MGRRLHGRVFRKQEMIGWEGESQIRLDVEGCWNKERRVHIYMPADDPLASLPVGAKIEIKVC